MQIAIVCGDDARADDGALSGAGLGDFCAALAGQQHAVTAYLRLAEEKSAAKTEQPHRIVSAGVGPTGPLPPAQVLPYVGEWAAQLDRAWASNPPDIVHAFGWLGGLAAQLAARRHALRTVQSFHGLAATASPSDETERVRLEPLLIRNATWVTGGSGEEVDALIRLRRKRAQVSVLSTGVDAERYTPTDLTSCDSGMLRVLQLEPNTAPSNGFGKVIQVLPKLPEIELVLAETGAAGTRPKRERAALKRLATRLGVSDRVRFAGTVAAAELPPLLHSADIVVCAPCHAPRATTALRAMASGVVVVATAVDALTDTVINGVTGLLVSPNNPHELALALRSLQAQRFQRESMGSAGRSRAMSRFTWERIALDALGVYQRATTSSVKTSATA